MAITITKPTVGGSSGTWGTELNTALDVIVTGVNQNSTDAAAKLSATVATAKGDLLVATAASTITRQPIGAAAYTLTVDSTQPTGVAWKLPPGSMVLKVSQSTTQTLTTSAEASIIWNTIEYDRFSVMNSGATTYYPGVAGYYEFTGGVGFASNATGARACWFVTTAGNAVGAGTQLPISGLPTSVCTRPTVVYLSASQGVSLNGYQTSGANLSTYAQVQYASTMSVKWLGPV